MSFWKKIFGGSGEAPAEVSGAKEEYKGFTIRPTLMRAGSEFQLAGTLEKEIDGETKVHQFVRADRFSSREDAENFSLAKGRQIIDEQGDSVFAQSWPHGAN